MRFSGALLLAVLLSACDTGDDVGPLTVAFDGVTYTAIGGATLEVTAAGLVVGRGTSAGEYGVRVPLGAAASAADFRVEPVDLRAGSRWGLALLGAPGNAGSATTEVAVAWADAVNDSVHALLFDFAPATGATSATLEYYLDGSLQLRVPNVPISLGGGRLRTINAGQGEDEPQSTHVVRDGTRYVVATDYGGAPPRTAAGGCSGVLLRLDFPGVPKLPNEVCTDYVQAVPNAFALTGGAERVEIRARAPLDAFTLTAGEIE